MKNTILILFLLVFASCSRDENNSNDQTQQTIQPTYFVKYKVNGVSLQDEFSTTSISEERIEQFTHKSDPAQKGTAIVLKSDLSSDNALRFFDGDYSSVRLKYGFDYNTFIVTPGMHDFVFKYMENGIKYMYGGYVNNSNDDSNFTVTITSVSNNVAIGTFSGKINAWTGSAGNSGTKKVFTLTEGTFKIPIINTVL